MKTADQIVSWGKIKPFFDKTYAFNTLDIETIDNELFMIGFTLDNDHQVIYDDFYNGLHNFLIRSLQSHKDILTWTRYDNTHLLKLILSKAKKADIDKILLRVGKITPIYSYEYKSFTVTIVNIIHDSIIIKLKDQNDKERNVVIYNLKNLYDTDLVDTAKNYGLTYYSKLGEEYHIIDKKRFVSDPDYQAMVIKANYLDNIVLLDIAKKMLADFQAISGKIPKSIFTCGSLARSYLLATKGTKGCKDLNFNMIFKGKMRNGLLDYAMRSYHGGKIESYILGYVPKAKEVDKTSAYPYAMSLLPRLTNLVIHDTDPELLKQYFYAFIRCEIVIRDPDLIHPIIVENPINKSNISPWGYLPDTTVITKPEYDYLIAKGCEVKVIDYYAIKHIDEYPYKTMIKTLFNERLATEFTNHSLSLMDKTILTSLYGISYELTDMYTDIDDNIEWIGYRAGDYFNPVIASYQTAMTRTSISEVSHNIIENGGRVFLNMTDSIMYDGNITLDVISDYKTLGWFKKPKIIKDVYILGAGRYEYKDEFTNKYVIKSRGFNVKVKDKSFYGSLDLNSDISLPHRTFVTCFKATTKKYPHEKLGYLIDDSYNFDPFNLGGKRIIENRNVDLNNDYTRTLPVYLEKGVIK